jgi:hypothetical protein
MGLTRKRALLERMRNKRKNKKEARSKGASLFPENMRQGFMQAIGKAVQGMRPDELHASRQKFAEMCPQTGGTGMFDHILKEVQVHGGGDTEGDGDTECSEADLDIDPAFQGLPKNLMNPETIAMFNKMMQGGGKGKSNEVKKMVMDQLDSLKTARPGKDLEIKKKAQRQVFPSQEDIAVARKAAAESFGDIPAPAKRENMVRPVRRKHRNDKKKRVKNKTK